MPEVSKATIPNYPDAAPITRDHRPFLHPLLNNLEAGVSEFCFASLYLFRHVYQYRLSLLPKDRVLVRGQEAGEPFFFLPLGFCDTELLKDLFSGCGTMKCATEEQARELEKKGYAVTEDRDNFDYLYDRELLARLPGRGFHRKKNLISAFIHQYTYEARPLMMDYRDDAIRVLEEWKEEKGKVADYSSAREALDAMEELELCGGIYYVDETPAAFTLGEDNNRGTSFVIHFEKALTRFKGLYQFVNQSFASILPEKFRTINREQDLGDPGLRKAKMSYKPSGFVRKYRIQQV